MKTVQDRDGNFRNADGKLYLIRCYVCEPEYGRENFGPAVASGKCVWCGWPEPCGHVMSAGDDGYYCEICGTFREADHEIKRD